MAPEAVSKSRVASVVVCLHCAYTDTTCPFCLELTITPNVQVQPLRIQKATPGSSPAKMNGGSVVRPLAEQSAARRNSPSYNQGTKVHHTLLILGDTY